jgi:predicted transposase/invertase (TIGR01784 family)
MTIANPHDAFFRKFLTRAEVARDFLQIHLPADIAEKCAWDTLSMEASSFVEPDLRQYYSDIVYRMRIGSSAGYISCVLEHQSTPYRLMAFRMARYALAVMQHHIDQGNKRLPLVVPVLFYHGRKRPYPYTTRFPDCFRGRRLAEKVYGRPFPLVDITVIPDEEILTHRNVAALELLQKHIQARDITLMAENLVQLLNSWSLGDELFDTAVCYTFQHGDASSVPRLLDMLTRKAPHHREKIMTIAQKLEQQGRMEGRHEGLEEGKKQASLKIARQLIASGVEPDNLSH